MTDITLIDGAVDKIKDSDTIINNALTALNDGKVEVNDAITGATKTKITYDAKGLVTAGADATQDDIGDGTTYKQYSNTEKTKLSGIETAADVTDATNVAAAGAVMEGDTTTAAMSFVIDEDTMASDIDTKVPTQQSVKAYVNAHISDTSTHGVAQIAGIADIPVKATGAEVDTGTDDAKFVTAKAIEDSAYIKSSGNAATATTLATARLINGSSFNGSANITNNFREGFLVNGKISPTVSSDNLTLAIKGVDGNDPSASNPVYCNIGGTVRAITASLAATAIAGSNVFNSGGAELATKAIDYFAYLGYNATDGVVIGFSRIPYARRYGHFSTTSTNQTYAVISTITHAAANDAYENIGRFEATLSAGAGYTWTVPTYTPSTLVQKPTRETLWRDWAPQYSCGGSMTFTSITTTQAKYKLIDNALCIDFFADGTTGGTAAANIKATLPFTVNSCRDSAYVYDSVRIGIVFFAADMDFYKYDMSNFALAAGKEISVVRTLRL